MIKRCCRELEGIAQQSELVAQMIASEGGEKNRQKGHGYYAVLAKGQSIINKLLRTPYKKMDGVWMSITS